MVLRPHVLFVLGAGWVAAWGLGVVVWVGGVLLVVVCAVLSSAPNAPL